MSDVVAFLKQMVQAFDPAAAAGANCVIQFNTSKPAYITIKDGTCAMAEGTAGNADVSLTIADDDLVALLKGELNGMMAFMTGKLQVDGDLMLGQRLASFFDREKLK
jgi:putative sterol carrier protein